MRFFQILSILTLVSELNLRIWQPLTSWPVSKSRCVIFKRFYKLKGFFEHIEWYFSTTFFAVLVSSSTLNNTSITIKHAKYNRHTCMVEQCLKCKKAFGKLFRSIVVSNVNSLPQQASVFMRIFSLSCVWWKTEVTREKTCFPTFSWQKIGLYKDPNELRIVLT